MAGHRKVKGIYFLTRLLTNVDEPGALLNSVGRTWPLVSQ